jgi:hypothetical protein
VARQRIDFGNRTYVGFPDNRQDAPENFAPSRDNYLSMGGSAATKCAVKERGAMNILYAMPLIGESLKRANHTALSSYDAS